MSASAEQSRGSGQLAPLLAGFCWGLFAATRWAVVLTGGQPDETTVVWLWPPWWQPLLVGLGAWLLQYLTSNWQRRWLLRQGLERAQARRRAARAWWPSLALLLVPALEFLAPLYAYNTALLALCREAWPLAAAAVAGAVCLQTALAAPELLGGKRGEHKVWLSVLVFFLALLVFAGVGLRLNQVTQEQGYLMAGDEPSYLLMTHSLAVDRDLDLSNNVLLRESSFFTDPNRLESGHGHWSPDRAWLSKHRPGLPLIMSPFYAWGLYSGMGARKLSTVLVWLLGAWMVLEVFWLARLYTRREGPALLAAAGACLALPGLIYSNLLFPEMAAAAFAVAAFRRLRQAPLGAWGAMLLAGLLTAYLAWFHERFIVLSLLLLLYALARGHWKSLKDLLAFLTPCAVSAWLLGMYFNFLYGQPFPPARIHAQGSYLNPRGAWEGLSGLWVDGGEGLLPFAAIWLAAVAGLLWLLRRRLADGFWVLVMTGATFVVAGLFTDWFGGINPPSRYLVAAMPFLAVGLAAGAHWAPRRFMLTTLVLALVSGAAAAFVLLNPPAVYGHKIVLGSGLQFPLIDNLLPAYIFHPEAAAANANLALLWMWVAALAVLALQIDGERFAPWSSLAILLTVFLAVSAAAVIADRIGPGMSAQAHTGTRLTLWQRVHSLPEGGPSWRAWGDLPKKDLLRLELPPYKFARPPAAPSRDNPSQLEIPQGVKPGLFLWGQYLRLPPGSYRATADLSSAYRGNEQVAWLEVSQDHGQKVLAKRTLSGEDIQSPVSLPFQLKRAAHNLEIRVGTTGKAALRLGGMSLTRVMPKE